MKTRRFITFLLSGMRHKKKPPTSSDYLLHSSNDIFAEEDNGWHDKRVAWAQAAAYQHLIRQMRSGQARVDLQAAAEAVRWTAVSVPLLLEVGCGSGYYSEILSFLLHDALRYVGMDYSDEMIRLARQHYPGRDFVVGDATQLPFEDNVFDIVLNGGSLMHILRYEEAVAESRRVARSWCIFHTVPVLQQRQTTVLRKKAYGAETIEVIFNEAELYQLFQQQDLAVKRVFESIPYNLESVLGEPTTTRTYVCKVSD